MRDVRGWLQAGAAALVAAVLLGLAGASGPLFVSSAGTAMLGDELEAVGDGLAMLDAHVSGPLSADELREVGRQLGTALEERTLPAAVPQVVIELRERGTGGRVNLIGIGGDAVQDLPPVLTGALGELAIPSDSADRLGLAAGDVLQVAGLASDERHLDLPVGPVLRPFDRSAMPASWRPVTGLLTAVDDPRIGPPPPALVTSYDAALAVLDQLAAAGGGGSEAAPGSGTHVQAGWLAFAPDDLTLERAEELVPQLEELRVRLVDPTTELGATLAQPGWSPPAIGGGRLDAAVTRVGAAVDQLAVPVALLGLTGQLLALGAVGAAVVLGGRRRMARARLWAVRGVPARALALRWVLSDAVPLAVGVAAGWGAADLLTRWLGPSGTLDASVRLGVWRQLALAWAVAMLVVGVVATVALRWQARAASTPTRVPPIAEVLAVVLAGLALWQADTRGLVTQGTDGTLRLDPLAVALPILLVVAIVGVGVRLVGPLLRAAGRTPGHRPAWFLASRRLRAFGGASMALTFLTATAVGLFVLATTLHASAAATVEEKAGLTIGADAVRNLSRATVTEPPDPDTMPTPATIVRRVPEARLDDRAVELLAIDPETFAEVAYSPRYLADVDLTALTASLADASDVGPRPAIAVGLALDGVTTVRVGEVVVDLEQVGDAPVFPGAATDRPTLVIPDGGPLAPEDPALTARLAVEVFPELWLDRAGLSQGAFRTELAAVELDDVGQAIGPGSTGVLHFQYAADLRDDPGVAPATWTFSYLRAQAAIVAVLGLLALILHHIARQRQQALGTDLAARMGLRRRSRIVTETIELAALATVTLVLGATAGGVAARTVVTSYDPVPDVALPVVFRLPLEMLSPPLAVLAVSVAAAVAITIRAVDRIDVATVLRSGV